MKIIFICGSVEYGRDGVGDYTRRLAGELISKGHEAGILALNEKYISTEINCKQKSGIYDIPVLRLSASFTYRQRLQSARLWIDEHNPEWLSLQFVPYAFHTKGMPFGLADALANMGKGRHWHIMFHELWIGMDINSSWTNYLSGLVQKYLIQSFISKLKPEVIHTQSNLYFTLLTQLGYNVHHMPLFGNIDLSDNAQIDKQLPNKNISGKQSFILFGGIHAAAPVGEFAKEVAAYCLENEVQGMLTIAGRCGEEQERWSSIWSGTGLAVQILGEQPPETISQELKSASWGIATTPLALIDKSGSVAAMMDHGLPVICVSRKWTPRHNIKVNIPAGVFEYKKGNVPEVFSLQKKQKGEGRISTITEQFLDSLLVRV